MSIDAAATNSQETPLLVAPRPVRLATHPFMPRAQPVRLVSAPDALERTSKEDLKSGAAESSPASPEKERASSPRQSPRSALPSEALEEFLSILKPAIFPPLSPRRPPSSLAISSDRSNGLFLLRNVLDDGEFSSELRSTTTPSPKYSDDLAQLRWAHVLSSPISRNNTRNPFHRHPSYAAARAISVSPALIPLPLSPSPSEDIISVA